MDSRRIVFSFFSLLIFLHCAVFGQPAPEHNLKFDSLASEWDEGMPLGNGMLGALIWKKDNRLRFSLDRADLWDQRRMRGTDVPEFRYKWIQEQVAKKEYAIVQKLMDEPYNTEAAPSKIPGAAIELD